jgi:hypothetical protein
MSAVQQFDVTSCLTISATRSSKLSLTWAGLWVAPEIVLLCRSVTELLQHITCPLVRPLTEFWRSWMSGQIFTLNHLKRNILLKIQSVCHRKHRKQTSQKQNRLILLRETDSVNVRIIRNTQIHYSDIKKELINKSCAVFHKLYEVNA